MHSNILQVVSLPVKVYKMSLPFNIPFCTIKPATEGFVKTIALYWGSKRTPRVIIGCGSCKERMQPLTNMYHFAPLIKNTEVFPLCRSRAQGCNYVEIELTLSLCPRQYNVIKLNISTETGVTLNKMDNLSLRFNKLMHQSCCLWNATEYMRGARQWQWIAIRRNSRAHVTLDNNRAIWCQTR